jgi:hypothetical protein
MAIKYLGNLSIGRQSRNNVHKAAVAITGLGYELAKIASTYGKPIAFVKTKGEVDVVSKLFNHSAEISSMEAQGELVNEFSGEVDGRYGRSPIICPAPPPRPRLPQFFFARRQHPSACISMLHQHVALFDL